MSKDTKRDRVWKTVLDMADETPTHKLTRGDGEVEGFTKADILARLNGDISKRTVHDVVMTMLDYGLIEMVKEPSYASIAKHPITGRAAQADVYNFSSDWTKGSQ